MSPKKGYNIPIPKQFFAYPMMLSLGPFMFTFLVFCLVKFRWPSTKPTLPPGPKRLPLIGNLHQLLDSLRLPHRFFANLAKQHGPIMHLQLGEVALVVLSSPKVAEEVLKNHDLQFSQRPLNASVNTVSFGGSGIVFAPYGNHWREMKRLFSVVLLNPKRVDSFRSMRVNEVWGLVESIKSSSCSQEPNPIINFSREILKLDARITCNAAFGFTCKEIDLAMDLLQEAAQCVFSLSDIFPSLRVPLEFITGKKRKFSRLHRRLDKILNDIIGEQKTRKAKNINEFITGEENEEDLLDVLLKLEESSEHPISMNHVKAIIWEIIGAGTETLAATIEWAMAEMMKNPEIMKKAQDEARHVLLGKNKTNVEEHIQDLGYIRLVIKETLRLHPPTPLAPRESIQKCEVNGYDIPKKTQVLLNIYAINRNQEWWGDDAHCFKPERFDGSRINYNGTFFEYLPFGTGRRMCPGISFANAVMELVLGLMLCHFDWKLPHGIKPDELDMEECFLITVKRRNNLYLIPTPFPSSFV